MLKTVKLKLVRDKSDSGSGVAHARRTAYKHRYLSEACPVNSVFAVLLPSASEGISDVRYGQTGGLEGAFAWCLSYMSHCYPTVAHSLVTSRSVNQNITAEGKVAK